MGFPIDDPVQQTPAAGDKTLSSSTDEKASVTAHDHATAPAPVSDIAYPYLEESIAYADAQYSKNDVIPQGDKLSPQESIRTGLLRLVWGAPSPELAVAAPKPMDMSLSVEDGIDESTAKELQNRRALRKVSAVTATYLILTDILGPFSTRECRGD